MWWDAFLSAALAGLAVVASPVVAALGLPDGVLFGFGMATIGCALLLAAFGAITAVLLVLRLREGQYQLPARLRLPLPAAMRPPTR